MRRLARPYSCGGVSPLESVDLGIGIWGHGVRDRRLPGPGFGQPEARLALSAGNVHTLSCLVQSCDGRAAFTAELHWGDCRTRTRGICRRAGSRIRHRTLRRPDFQIRRSRIAWANRLMVTKVAALAFQIPEVEGTVRFAHQPKVGSLQAVLFGKPIFSNSAANLASDLRMSNTGRTPNHASSAERNSCALASHSKARSRSPRLMKAVARAGAPSAETRPRRRA